MNKLFIGVCVTIVIVFLALMLLANMKDKYNFKEIDFNEEVRLERFETAKIKGKDITITIISFVKSPPPIGTQSIWSGLSVNYELQIDGVVHTNSYETPYDVIIVDSDYETYAIVKVVEK